MNTFVLGGIYRRGGDPGPPPSFPRVVPIVRLSVTVRTRIEVEHGMSRGVSLRRTARTRFRFGYV